MIRPWAANPAGGRLGAYAPVPFVGAASILVALIVFTPVLLASGPSPLALEAELVVYRVPGGSSTQFDVHAIGALVPYAQVNVSIGSGFPWSGSCPSSGVTWNYTNVSATLGLSVSTGASPIVVNASATYSSGGTTDIYAAELAFEIVDFGSPGESLSIVPCSSATPGVSSPGSWPVSELPHAWLLVNFGSGGPP
jgi:hypothetical protein